MCLIFAYYQTQEFQNWFITQEIFLFKMRFMSLSIENIHTFLFIYSVQIKCVSCIWLLGVVDVVIINDHNIF